jgi:tetratricopeptide (TPR) repeat protein
VLELDPDNAPAWCGLGVISMRQKRHEEAVDQLLHALGLMYYYPRAHLFLGIALVRLGWWDRARQAFEVCVRMYPRLLAAYRYLAAIHGKLGHPAEAMYYHHRVRQMLDEAKAAGIGPSGRRMKLDRVRSEM